VIGFLGFQAGIVGGHLTIALEPEAASMFCRHVPVQKLGVGESFRPFDPGNRYLVLDAGGTISITFFFQLIYIKESTVKPVYKVHLRDWPQSGLYRQVDFISRVIFVEE